MMHKISVIIPVLNDAAVLKTLLEHLRTAADQSYLEVRVVDGGSEDDLNFVSDFRAKLLRSNRSGRAIQMNLGAKHARHKILYFVHAAPLPPRSFVQDINRALDRGQTVGCFRLKLCPSSFLLNINSFLSGFRHRFSGGGDQSLYIPKNLFEQQGGYNERFSIMEDFELVHRLIPKYGYHITPKNILASSRKHKLHSYFKVN